MWIVIVLGIVLTLFFLMAVVIHLDNPPKKSMEDYWSEEPRGIISVDQSLSDDNFDPFADSVETEKAIKKQKTEESKRHLYDVMLRGLEFKKAKMWNFDSAVAFAEEEIIIVNYIFDEGLYKLYKNFSVKYTDIIKIDVDQLTKTVNIRKTEYVDVEVRKNKSAIGRGIAGALVAGPVGALVGAASAVSNSSKIERVAKDYFEATEVNADCRLTIWIRSLGDPSVHIDFSTASDARGVAVWIEDCVQRGKGG